MIVALIPVASRHHEFRFDGPMTRAGLAHSPTAYNISGPTASEDSWWIAESGTIQVTCRGVYTPSVGGARQWLGSATYAGRSHLHMVMSVGHPAF